MTGYNTETNIVGGSNQKNVIYQATISEPDKGIFSNSRDFTFLEHFKSGYKRMNNSLHRKKKEQEVKLESRIRSKFSKRLIADVNVSMTNTSNTEIEGPELK